MVICPREGYTVGRYLQSTQLFCTALIAWCDENFPFKEGISFFLGEASRIKSGHIYLYRHQKISKRLRERPQEVTKETRTSAKRKTKLDPNQLQNSTLLGQATWSSFTVSFLCCFPVALLLLLGRLLRRLGSCTGSRGRGLGLRLGTAM